MAIRRSDDMWLVAYAMARCGDDRAPPPWLGATAWNGAYDQFYPSLGDGRSRDSFAHSLKNARDTFDPYVDRPVRTGWRAADHSVPPPRPIVRKVLDVWAERPDEALRDAVLTIRGRPLSSRPAGAAIRLLTDAAAIEQVWRRWFGAMTAQAEPVGEGRWWNPGVRLHVRSRLENGAPQAVFLSQEEEAVHWTVELNPLGRPGDANRLTGIGEAADGRLWLMRQGWLHPHTLSAPHIKDAAFRAGTGLEPAPVRAGSGPQDRDWYAVCRLDASDAEMLAATTLFVARCDLARRQHDPDPPSAEEVSQLLSLLAGDETMGYLLHRARPAEGEKKVWKQHAEVWSALRSELEGAGLRLEKVRPAPGYEVDGVIPMPEPLLVEIKTGASAADIYTAVGQLTLYRRLICPKDSHHLIMVLPKAPSAPLQRVLRDMDFRICVYRREGDEAGERGRIHFDATLAHLWLDSN